jgi:diaminopimelate decarboxylase
VDFLNKHAGIPKTICCRYNPGGDFTIHNKIMDSPKDAKYGMTKVQIKEAFVKLKELGAETFGIHAFLASNTLGGQYYPKLSEELFNLVLEIKNETGITASFINLSGGVGVAYKPQDEDNDIAQIGEDVHKMYEKVLAANGIELAIFTELGRFMLAENGHLVATAIHEKHIYKEYIGLDACAANLMRPAMYGSYHHITIAGKENADNTNRYDITGGLCENNDKFAVDRELPKIEIGDYVIIHDTGAHGFAMGYNYNGKLRSDELLLKEDGNVKLIRRAETPEDYFATIENYM